MMKENEEFLAANLSAEQKKRLEQISMQTAGLLWITRPSIAKELKLTDEQKQKATQMQQEAHKKFREAVHAKTNELRKEKLAALNQASQEELMKLLTNDQKTRYQELAGAPFKGGLHFEEPMK